MILIISKYYEGPNVSGAVGSVINTEVTEAMTLKEIRVSGKDNVTPSDALFHLKKNGVNITGGGVTVAVGTKKGEATALDVALAEDDELDLAMLSGALNSPIVLTLTVDIAVDTSGLTDSTDKRFVTDAEKTKLSNLSGANSGDQTLNGLLPAQTGNSGKVLKTDGTNASWQNEAGGGGGDLTTIDGKAVIIPVSWAGKNGYILQYNEFTNKFEFLPKTSNPISPAALPTSPTVPIWYAYEAFRETGLANNDLVAQFTDQTGNARHAVQAAANNKPKYRTGQINSLAAWQFDNVSNNKFVTLPNMSALTAIEVWHVWISMVALSDTAAGMHNFGTDGASNHLDYNDRTIYDDFGRGGRINFAYGYSLNSVDLRLWSCTGHISVAGENSFYFNGVQKATTASNTVAINSAPTIGQAGATGINMFLAASYGFSAKLDSTQRTIMKDYIYGKFGIVMT